MVTDRRSQFTIHMFSEIFDFCNIRPERASVRNMLLVDVEDDIDIIAEKSLENV